MAAALSPELLARLQAYFASPDAGAAYFDPASNMAFRRAENPALNGYAFAGNALTEPNGPGTSQHLYGADGAYTGERVRPKYGFMDNLIASDAIPLAMLAAPFILPAMGFGAAGAGAGELAGAGAADFTMGGAGGATAFTPATAAEMGSMGLGGVGELSGASGVGTMLGNSAGGTLAGAGEFTMPEGVAFTPSTAAEMGSMGLPQTASIGGFGGGGSILTGSSALTGGGAGGVGAGYGITPGALGTAAATTGGASGIGALLPGGLGSLITPAAQIIGGALTANAAGNAADAMAGAANAGIAENRRQFDLTRQLLQPYVDAGTGALGSYQALSGAGGTQAQQAAMAALEASPQYASLTKAGENAILQNASATGGLRGGNVQGALADQRTQHLNSLAQQQLQRYAPLITGGQASAAGVGAQGMAMGQNNAQLLGQAGAANAGGIVAGNNAITSALGNVGGFFAGQQAQSLPPVDLRTGMNFGSAVVPGYSSGARLF